MGIKFENVEEIKTSSKLGIGRHLVKISRCTNVFTNRETNETVNLVDGNGVEKWNITYKDKDNNVHYEDAQFSGIWANKTGFMFKAIGLLEPDEKLTETKKEFECEDVLEKYLYITIEQDPKRIGTKYELRVKFDGYEAYDGKQPESKPAKKAEVVEDPF